MRTPRPVRTLAAAAALTAALTTVLAPGTAAAATTTAADDRIDCEVTLYLYSGSVAYTCETESEDIRWWITGTCTLPLGIGFTRSETVEGSGTAIAGCPRGPGGFSMIRSHQLVVQN